MKLYDEDGNYVGEFLESTKEKVENAFEGSFELPQIVRTVQKSALVGNIEF